MDDAERENAESNRKTQAARNWMTVRLSVIANGVLVTEQSDGSTHCYTDPDKALEHARKFIESRTKPQS